MGEGGKLAERSCCWTQSGSLTLLGALCTVTLKSQPKSFSCLKAPAASAMASGRAVHAA